MLIEAARLALADVFSLEMRRVLWKVLGITLLVLLASWLALRQLFMSLALPFIQGFFPDLPDWTGWLVFVFLAMAGIGLAAGLAFLLSPVTALVAGLFLDDVADVVERRNYPGEPAGRAMPLGASIASSLKFMGVVIVGNVVALFLLFIPGINIAAFFLVNGYLLGREFFEFAAMRFRPPQEARLFRSRHAMTAFLAGLLISVFLAIPLLNLLTSLFAAAMMVHLHRSLSREQASAGNGLRA